MNAFSTIVICKKASKNNDIIKIIVSDGNTIPIVENTEPKNDIIEYCDTIYNLIEDDEYFTIHSIKELNVTSKLDELGFDDFFFANILAMSQKFQYTQVFGNLVLYKGQAEKGISKKSLHFIKSMLE